MKRKRLKTKQLVVRLTPRMLRQIEEAAAADCDSSVSSWVRRTLLARVKQERKDER